MRGERGGIEERERRRGNGREGEGRGEKGEGRGERGGWIGRKEKGDQIGGDETEKGGGDDQRRFARICL